MWALSQNRAKSISDLACSLTSFCLGWKGWARRLCHSGNERLDSEAGAGRRSFIPMRRPANSTAWDSSRSSTHYGEAGAARPSSAETLFLHDPVQDAHAVRHSLQIFNAHISQAGRIICTAASLSILPTGETFPSFSLRTILSIWTIAPRCQLSRASL